MSQTQLHRQFIEGGAAGGSIICGTGTGQQHAAIEAAPAQNSSLPAHGSRGADARAQLSAKSSDIRAKMKDAAPGAAATSAGGPALSVRQQAMGSGQQTPAVSRDPRRQAAALPQQPEQGRPDGLHAARALPAAPERLPSSDRETSSLEDTARLGAAMTSSRGAVRGRTESAAEKASGQVCNVSMQGLAAIRQCW